MLNRRTAVGSASNAQSFKRIVMFRKSACCGLMMIGACTTPRPVVQSTAAVSAPPSACAAAREQARAGATVNPPTLMRIFTPPVPVPSGVRGQVAQVRIRVDTAGRPQPDGITISGISDQEYTTRMRATFMRARFRPAMLDGCTVDGVAEFTNAFRR